MTSKESSISSFYMSLWINLMPKIPSATTNYFDSFHHSSHHLGLTLTVYWMFAWDTQGILRFLICAPGYNQADGCGSIVSRVSHWEQIPAWSRRDFTLATCVNLPGVKATPRSRGLSIVGRGCLLTVRTWIAQNDRELIGVESHSVTFGGVEFTQKGLNKDQKYYFLHAK